MPASAEASRTPGTGGNGGSGTASGDTLVAMASFLDDATGYFGGGWALSVARTGEPSPETEADAKVEEYARALADAEARARAAEPAQQQLEALTAEREHLLAAMRDEREHARLQAEEASASLGSAEARLAKESTRAAALERELMSFGSALAERVGRLAELEAELAEGGTRVDRERSVPIHVRTGHVCFVLVAGGYKLIDVDTAPARPGELVELEGKRFVAARIGRSPIPGDTRPCVYLLEDPDSDGDFHLPDPNELDPSDPSVMAAPDRSTRFEGSSHGEQGAQG